jgi:hypothetical protein
VVLAMFPQIQQRRPAKASRSELSRKALRRRRVRPHWQSRHGDFSDAQVIRRFGDVPDDLSAL